MHLAVQKAEAGSHHHDARRHLILDVVYNIKGNVQNKVCEDNVSYLVIPPRR